MPRSFLLHSLLHSLLLKLWRTYCMHACLKDALVSRLRIAAAFAASMHGTFETKEH